MRTITTAALMMAALAATPASAQAPSAGAAAPGPAKLCTTATTVVRRGDVVVGDNTSTRCDDEAATSPTDVCTTSITIVRRGGVVVSSTGATKCEDESAPGGGTAKAVFGAPAGALSAISKGLLAGGGDRATASNVRGEWKVMDSRADRVCHLFLTSQPDPAGFRVRRTDCKGMIARVQAWTFEGEGVALHETGGGVIITLAGSRAQLQGRTAAGKPVLIQR